MRRVRGKVLSHQFAKQGVEIEPEIDKVLNAPALDNGGLWLPTNILEAIAVASELVQSKRELANGTIRKTPRIVRDTPANTLVDILNDSVERWDRADQITIDDRATANDYDSCPHAEIYFLEALEELEQTEPGERPNLTQQIIHQDGKALIFRKKTDISSGLALEPIKINGISYPPGSILAVKSQIRYSPTKERRFRVIPFSEVEKLTFVRLSAFALRPDERRKSFTFDTEYFNDDPYGWELFARTTINDVGRIVNQALVRLDVPGTT